MRVVVLRHGQGEPETLASRSFSFAFSESVHGPPWHRLQATVGVPLGAALRGRMAPSARDWIALETDGFARALGRVSDVQFNASEGPISRTTMTVSAEGFLDAARSNDVISVGARAGEDTVGTLFGYQDWVDQTVGPFVNEFARGDLGKLLQQLVKTLVRVRAPELMLGQTNLGDAIYVLHATDSTVGGSAAMIGSDRVLDPVAGFNVGGVRSFIKTQAKAIEFLTGTFAPSDMLIELFPSLEPFTLKGLASDKPTVLGNYLTIVYRIKPWRAEALTDATQPRFNATGVSVGPQGNLVNPFFTPEKFPNDAFSFDRVTWLPDRAVRVGPPLSFNGRLSNDAIVNATTAQLAAMGGGSSDGLRVMRALGLPIMKSADEIERDGLRTAAVLWPFLPAAGTKEDKDGGRMRMQDVLAFTQRLAAQVMQFYAPAADLLSGVTTVGLDLRVRAGEIVKIPVADDLLVAYVESVEHRLESDNRGVVTGTTTINYSRGAVDESVRRVAFELPPIDMKFIEDGSDVEEGGRHEGLVFGKKEFECVLDWPWVAGNAVNIPVRSADRTFVFGDSEPTEKQIKEIVDPSGTNALLAVQYETMRAQLSTAGWVVPPFIYGGDAATQVDGLRAMMTGLNLTPPARINSTTLNRRIVAAKGESYGTYRPSVERMAVTLGATLRDPTAIDKVVIHSPGGAHRGRACGAARTYVSNYEGGEQVAAHFIIDRKGCVWQMLDAYRYAAHALGYYVNGARPQGSTDFVNRTSIGIDVVVGSSHMTFAEHHKLRDEGWEYPTAEPVALSGNGDVNTIFGGNYPEGGLNEVTLLRAHMNVGLPDLLRSSAGGRAIQRTRYAQPSRDQYRALGALLSLIGDRCPNLRFEFPGQDALPEFTWKAMPTSTRDGRGYYDASTLPPGLYLHATLQNDRTDHLGLNRARVKAYCGTASEVRNRRAYGDTI